MDETIVSMSGLNLFKRCPKAYELAYERGLEPPKAPGGALQDGSDFHAYAAAYARERRGEAAPEPPYNEEMYEVFREWAARRGAAMFDSARKITLVEDSVYTDLIPGYKLRTTYDLAYVDEHGWTVLVDYKTFAKLPSIDADLDFQARCYIAAEMLRTGSEKIKFVHYYIRRTPPGVPHNKKGDVWSEDECYLENEIVITKAEALRHWSEVVWAAEVLDFARCEESRRAWYRNHLKGGGYTDCASCRYREPCKAENEHGVLTDDTIDLLGFTRREPRKEVA